MTGNEVAKLFWTLMSEEASVTADQLKERALEMGADPKRIDRQIDGAIRQLTIKQLITDGTDSNQCRYFVLSKQGQKQVRKETKSLERPERGETFEAIVTFRLTAPSLSGTIPPDSAEVGRLEWPRDADGNVVLLPVWFKGMWRKVLEQTGTIPRFVADWLEFQPISLKVETRWVKIPVPPDKPGGRGMGVNVIETLPAGTEITVRGLYPGRALPQDKLEALWKLAGWTGFSPGKSKLGYGTFEVIRCEYVGTVNLDSVSEAAD